MLQLKVKVRPTDIMASSQGSKPASQVPERRMAAEMYRQANVSDAASGADVGQDTVPTLSIEELEADPHGVFSRYRSRLPFVAHEAGGYLVLRLADVEQLSRDPRLRATETEYPQMRGFTEGAVFDAFKYSMLTSNAEVHHKRRSPFTRTFAARLIAGFRITSSAS
jgi:cytochrome P450 family 103